MTGLNYLEAITLKEAARFSRWFRSSELELRRGRPPARPPMSSSQVLRVLRSLESLGYLKRSPGARHWHITEGGRAAAAKLTHANHRAIEPDARGP